MIAPMTMDALADIAQALGFELRRAPLSVPVGVDFDRAKDETQFALLHAGKVAFDGTARECAAFLIGWRDLRSRMLTELRAHETKVLPDMHASTRCGVLDKAGHRCIKLVGHDGWRHATLVYWEDPQ
jgi:hypothetical protein